MEGAARFIRAYNKNRFSRFLTTWCSTRCIAKGKFSDKLFHGKLLQVEQANEPSLINWENVSLSFFQRKCRCFTGLLFAFLLLTLATIFIAFLKVEGDLMIRDKPNCAG